jgi:hypothetical protein
MRSGELKFDGQTYLLHFLLPNLFFHTTSYDICARPACRWARPISSAARRNGRRAGADRDEAAARGRAGSGKQHPIGGTSERLGECPCRPEA